MPESIRMAADVSRWAPEPKEGKQLGAQNLIHHGAFPLQITYCTNYVGIACVARVFI